MRTPVLPAQEEHALLRLLQQHLVLPDGLLWRLPRGIALGLARERYCQHVLCSLCGFKGMHELPTLTGLLDLAAEASVICSASALGKAVRICCCYCALNLQRCILWLRMPSA